MKVIPCGYGNSKHRDLIPKLMTSHDTLLVDIRLSPRSAVPGWHRTSLERRFGEQFRWLSALGNVHYKQPELGIEIADLETGLPDLLELLWNGKTVLLLCGCGAMEPTRQHPHGCHRRVVCDALVEACSEVEIVMPEKLLAREQVLERLQDEREALFMSLNNIKPAMTDYWRLPVAQQAQVRQQIGR